MSNNSEILAIHAALLPTNQVLMFGGSEHNASQNLSGNPADLDNTRLFTLTGGAPLIEAVGSPTTDAFCSGHAFLGDGRLLVAGGTKEWAGAHAGHPHGLNFLGERAAWTYLPRARTWRRVRDLNFEPGASAGGGRWYPTLITLASGEILAVAGHPDGTDSRHNNDTPERYSAGMNAWTLLTAERLDAGNRSRYYPRCHVLPDGNVFYTSPLDGSCRVWNPVTGTTVSTIPPPGGGLYDSSWDFPSVLLPLLPTDGYRARVLICGDVSPRKIDLSQGNPMWQNTSGRQGSAAGKQRRFGCAVILPTGDIFVCGGINGGTSDANGVKEGELYSPGIDWTTGQYSGTDGWTTADPATYVRNYHSTALLLPNGRVWVGGSSKDAAAGDPATVGELHIEVYKPSYDGDPNRPVLAGAPPSVGYYQTFEIQTPQAADIRRVALTRCGSNTHAFDADQRYVGLAFSLLQSDRIRVSSPPNSRIAPPGHYLLWVIDQAGRPCQTARFIRVCPQRLIVITDRNAFSVHEVQALGTPAVFPNAFYVVLEGFLPSEVGTPPLTPALTFTRPDGSSVPGMTADLNRVLYEDDTVPPDVAQRVTFVFNVRFTSLQAFNEIPAADDFQTASLRAVHGGNSETAPIIISRNPNPYMRDGSIHWLSTDLRVFKLRPGMTRAGVTLGSAQDAPILFIQQLLSSFNGTPTDEYHPFFDISEDPQVSQLELASHVAGQPVFNFAVAKVRYRAPPGINASDARVFFRLFNTAATHLAFNSTTYARNGAGSSAAPLLGLVGGEIVSIPFVAEPREADMRNQLDVPNRKTLLGGGSTEVTTYFGCWLDFNQPTTRFPQSPPHNGSGGAFSGTLLSIQQLVRNHHCCFVAEIHYPPDPILDGATPGSHDNLAQRNLVIVETANPGVAATRTVQSTFAIKPSPVPMIVPQAFGLLQDQLAGPGVAAVAEGRKPRIDHDELLIRWNNLPRDSRATLYIPSISAHEVASVAGSRGGPAVLDALDSRTLLCRIGDVSYVPIPGPRETIIPGLLSIELPPTVTRGQSFTVTIHQVTGYPRKILGSFQVTVPVDTAPMILPTEIRKLSVLRHVRESVPEGTHWAPIWERYLNQVADRVRGLGGNPDTVIPSPTGEPPAIRPPVPGPAARKAPWRRVAGLALIALYLMGILVGAGYVLISLWPSAPPSTPPAPGAINVTLGWSTFTISEEVRVIGLVLVAGSIGSAAYGLYAEFLHVARRDFSFRWTLWYIARPFIGAFFGLIFYLALRAGLFSTGAPLSELNVFGFTALAALVGMFSEETLAKFKVIAESFLTKPEFFTEDFDTGEPAPADGAYVFVEHPGAECTIDHTGETEQLKKGDPLSGGERVRQESNLDAITVVRPHS